jgi:1-acyl-sn-glycerol-3-phosphate acyltransferase
MNNNFINNKYINSICICNIKLMDDNVVTLFPCEHILHTDCIYTINGNNMRKPIDKYVCPLCGIKITDIKTFSEIKALRYDRTYDRTYERTYYQNYIDLVSLKGIKSGSINYMNLLKNTPFLLSSYYYFKSITSVDELNYLMDILIKTLNIQINIINPEKIINRRKVIISNQSTHLDGLIIYKIFKCGFVGINKMKKIELLQQIIKFIPFVFLDRGHGIRGHDNRIRESNNIEKMRKHLLHNDLCIFPEGMISNTHTLVQFRSGFTKLDTIVQPIIIKCDPAINDTNSMIYLMKGLSQSKIIVNVTILDPIYPPFASNVVESIRHDMARIGNFALSRVSNRDIID